MIKTIPCNIVKLSVESKDVNIQAVVGASCPFFQPIDTGDRQLCQLRPSQALQPCSPILVSYGSCRVLLQDSGPFGTHFEQMQMAQGGINTTRCTKSSKSRATYGDRSLLENHKSAGNSTVTLAVTLHESLMERRNLGGQTLPGAWTSTLLSCNLQRRIYSQGFFSQGSDSI